MEDKVMDQPLISVVMATYNGERFIAEAIQSVLDQTFSQFEFIIVDDGSTDATPSIIASFDDPRIVYLKKDANTGIADSLNLGIAKARGQYIARMDDDDVCMPNRFVKQLKVFENDDSIIFCGSNVTDNNGKPLRTPEQHQDIVLELLFRNPIFHPTAMIKREALLKEPYDINSVPSEDYDLWSRLIFKGKFYQFKEPLLYCRVHQNSVTMNRRKEQLLKNVEIVNYLFDKIGFTGLINEGDCLKIFVSKDYSISGKTLVKLMEWFNHLKQRNTELKIFKSKKFNTMVKLQLETYLVSYFTNRKLNKKLLPFLCLNFKYQVFIVKYYFKKLF